LPVREHITEAMPVPRGDRAAMSDKMLRRPGISAVFVVFFDVQSN
jgi:hypothetical protein